MTAQEAIDFLENSYRFNVPERATEFTAWQTLKDVLAQQTNNKPQGKTDRDNCKWFLSGCEAARHKCWCAFYNCSRPASPGAA